MPIDEFYNLIKRQEEKEAYYEELYEGFSNKLPPQLTEVVFKHLPELKKNRIKYEKAVFEIAQKYVREIWEEYNSVYSLNYKGGGPMADLNPVEKPGTGREKAEKRLQKLKKELPAEYHERLQESFWETYEDELATEVFKYAVYEKMKEVFTEFYIDDIMEFESKFLRYLDRSLYLMCTLRFVDEVFSLE
ncbi:MAG: hypothetical protein ABFS16_11760 [Bacteroidota bacterium]